MSIESLEEKLSELYCFRKNYFLNHPIEDAALKEERIDQKIQDIVKSIASFKQDVGNKSCGSPEESLTREQLAELCYIEGKARNAATSFDLSCQELLTKALKLNPKLGNTTDIHVQLGECFWKKLDREGARLSFEQSLKSSEPEITKQGKRNLSILLRQVAASSQDKEEHMEYMDRSIKLVKEAIQIDFTDGVSWYILGNAHFSQFFVDGQKPEIMKQALQAYKNAFKDKLSHFNCDLLYNYGVLLKFQENYQESLKSLQLATKLDPLWEEAEKQATQLESLLIKLSELVANRGGLKLKQFEKIVSKFDGSQLGCFREPFKDLKTEKLIDLKPCCLKELINNGSIIDSKSYYDKVCLLRIVAEIGQHVEQPPYYCVAADSNGSLCAISIFNAAINFHLQRGDSIAIAQPDLSRHSFDIETLKSPPSSSGGGDRNFSHVDFVLIRVNTPLDIVVNGRKGNKGMQAMVYVGVEAKAS